MEQRRPSVRYLRAYALGKQYRKRGVGFRAAWEEEIWNRSPSSKYHIDPYHQPVTSVFFGAGVYGAPLPEYVVGWRYGDLPIGGQSHNFADNRQEPGTSMMQVIGEERTGGTYEMFNAHGKKRVCAAGWLHYRRGSDGEPLLVSPTRVPMTSCRIFFAHKKSKLKRGR